MIGFFIIGLLCALMASAENTGNCRIHYHNMSQARNIFCDDLNIDGQDNPLDSIVVPKTTALISLSLKNCTGKISKESLPNLRDLNALFLVETKLDEFVLPSMLKLFYLTIVKSTIPTLEGALKNEKALRSFELSNNNFKLDVNSFKGLSSLTKLKISEQAVDLSKDLFKDLKSLSTLKLTKNNIEKIPRNVFQENSELISLSFGENPTKIIEHGALDPLKKLKFLQMESTNLETFNVELVKELIKLESLGIPARTLKDLDLKKLLTYCPNFREFYFLPKDTECAGVKQLKDEIQKIDASISLTFTGDEESEKSC